MSLLRIACPPNHHLVPQSISDVVGDDYLNSIIAKHAMPRPTRTHAVAHGLLGVLTYHWADLPPGPEPDLVTLAAARNHVAVLAWLIARGEGTPSIDTLYAAIDAGSVKTLAWLVQHFPPPADANLADWAATTGQLDVLQWLLDRDCKVSAMGLVQAALLPDRVTLKWFLEDPATRVEPMVDGVHDPVTYYMLGVREPDPVIVAALARAFPQCVDESHAEEAADRGLVPVLAALYHACPSACTPNLYVLAAHANRGNVIGWLATNTAIPPPADLAEACISGRALEAALAHNLLRSSRKRPRE